MFPVEYSQYQEDTRLEVATERRRLVERRIKRRRLYALITAICLMFLYLFVIAINSKLSNRSLEAATVVMAKSGSQIEAPSKVPFGKVEGSDLVLYVPSSIQNVSGIGYHQSFNKGSLPIKPSINQLGGEPTKAEVREKTRLGRPLEFIMSKRGRGTPLNSSVDITMIEGSDVLSPVDGVVIDVIPYKLYGRQDDFRVEIMADDYGWFKIVIAHIKDVAVIKGQRVSAGITRLARVRALGINSQINDYVDGSKDHVHIQVNPL